MLCLMASMSTGSYSCCCCGGNGGGLGSLLMSSGISCCICCSVASVGGPDNTLRACASSLSCKCCIICLMSSASCWCCSFRLGCRVVLSLGVVSTRSSWNCPLYILCMRALMVLACVALPWPRLPARRLLMLCSVSCGISISNFHPLSASS